MSFAYTNPTSVAPMPVLNAVISYAQIAALITNQQAAHGALGQPGGIATLGPDGKLLQAAGGGVVSVKDYGAKGDGTTDDTAAFNAAVTAMAYTGSPNLGAGGTVYVPAATYRISGTILMRSNVWLAGDGAMQSVLAAAPSWNPASETAMIALADVNQEFCGVKSLALTSAPSTSTHITGIWFANAGGSLQHSDAAHTITDVYIDQIGLHGIHFGDGGPGANKVGNVRVFLAGGNGYLINSVDNLFVNCECGASGLDGFKVADANNMLANCKGWYSGLGTLNTPHAGSGFAISDARNTFAGCSAQDNNGDGFNVGGIDHVLSGCLADSNGYNHGTSGKVGGTYTGSGFYVTSGRATITGAALDKNEGSRGVFQQYGVHIVNPMTGTIQVSTDNNAVGSLGGITASPGLSLFISDGGAATYGGGGAVGQSFWTPGGLTVQSAPATAPGPGYIGLSGVSDYLNETMEPPLVSHTAMTSGGAFYQLQEPPWSTSVLLAQGVPAAASNLAALRVPYATTLRRVDVHAITAPTGGTLIVQVNHNGPQVVVEVDIPAGATQGGKAVNIPLAAGDMVSFNVITPNSAAGVSVALSSVTNRTYSSTILHDGPALFWPLNETSGTTANDTTGNGHNGTYTGGFTLGVPGPLADGSTAVGLDGTSGYVTAPAAAPLQLGTGPWTVELWAMFPAAPPVSSFPDMVGLGGGNSATSGWSSFYDNGAIFFKTYTAAGASYQDNTNFTLVGGWHHVVYAYDGANLGYYYDGTQEFVDTVALRPQDTQGNPFRVGYINHYAAARFSNVAIYAKCLTPSQIAAHHGAATITAPSYVF